MLERFSILKRWPLILATVLLSLLFSALFLISMDRAKDARSAELSLDSDGALSAPKKGLTLSTRLGDLPPAKPVPRQPFEPGPWWPAALFGIAFFCGWLFRNALRRTNTQVANVTSEPAAHKHEPTPASVDEYVFKPGANHPDDSSQTPDLAVDFPWDDAALDDSASLSSEEQIARLEKQNASKAEIIKALERLVAENREKWLHQDETEARLDKHIRDLSDDLRVAVRQLQQLQIDKPASAAKPLKNIV